jgi:hypothetical protein
VRADRGFACGGGRSADGIVVDWRLRLIGMTKCRGKLDAALVSRVHKSFVRNLTDCPRLLLYTHGVPAKRQRVSKLPTPHNGNGQPSNGGQPPGHRTHLEQMLELIGCQTVEMQRLAARAADSSAKSSRVSASRPKSSR